ncbi:MAG: 2-oxoglutarate oxidoreductase [Deltaproteobacteria bacterium]|nr:2-oxoglutarate oxidoreductase [Deltaproteobacteria bacterium]MBW1961060.1 2-oxoglutarate oxidoreductase [Deltaproteobacteria bacterium]MBW2150076.1 2-oxoglutarate oxidoreductase [Deltaproteobacteria bacterium]
MAKTYQKPQALSETYTHYCPGCTHGIIHRLVAEVIDELGIHGRTVGIAPVGCAVLMYNYFTFDFQEAAHGRAPAVATGVKRVRPDLIVFTYQGDGDLASIGIAEIIHAANRGEKFTTIFVNNAVYGMTGGQMAPTTMPEQQTTTSPYGRDTAESGMPIRMVEMLSTLSTPAYLSRHTVIRPKYVIRAKKAIKKAFTYQLENRCFSLVEVVSTCPTNWRMTPQEAIEWTEKTLLAYFKLGEYKTPEGSEEGIDAM